MARYIDADYLIKKVFPYDVVDLRCYAINAKAVYEEIQKAPTADVVEVVRCKDCRMFVNNKEAKVTYCIRERKNMTVNETDFCSYGERKI